MTKIFVALVEENPMMTKNCQYRGDSKDNIQPHTPQLCFVMRHNTSNIIHSPASAEDIRGFCSHLDIFSTAITILLDQQRKNNNYLRYMYYLNP